MNKREVQNDLIVYNFIEQKKGCMKKLESLSKKNSESILKFCNQLTNKGKSEATQMKYLVNLINLATILKKDFDKIDKKDVENLVNKLSKKYSKNTTGSLVIVLKKFLQWLKNMPKGTYPEEVNWLEGFNTRHTNNIKPEDLITESDIQKMLNVAEHPRDKAFIMTLFESGCRIGEMLTLHIKNINFDNLGAYFMVNGKTGSRRVRVVNSTPFLHTWLNHHPEKNNKDAPLWVVVGTTKDISKKMRDDEKLKKEYILNFKYNLDYAAARGILVRIAKKAGINKPINPHNFRHSRATKLGASGLNAPIMNEVMGWKQGSNVSGVYLHLAGQCDDALLSAVYGMKIEEKKDRNPETFPIKCVECGHLNPYDAKRCEKCNNIIGKIKITIDEKNKEKEFEDMKKLLSELKEKYDELSGDVAMEEMDKYGKYGMISDVGMKPPIEVKITKAERGRLNKVWNKR